MSIINLVPARSADVAEHMLTRAGFEKDERHRTDRLATGLKNLLRANRVQMSIINLVPARSADVAEHMLTRAQVSKKVKDIEQTGLQQD